MSAKQQRDFRRLLSKLIDGLATDEEVAELSELIGSNDSLQDDLVSFMQREAALDELHCRDLLAPAFDSENSRSLLPGEAIAAGSVLSADKHIKRQTAPAGQSLSAMGQLYRNLQSKMNSAAIWAVAASLILAMAVAVLWPRSHATLLATDNVSWTNGQHFQSGDRLGSEWVGFESGSIQLAFASSAAMKIEGPARFRASGNGYCELEVGTALVYVPAAAKGFTVETPQMRVIDLGTSFRVTAVENEHTVVQVLEGMVEAKARQSGQTKTLLAGDVATVVQDEPQALNIAGQDGIYPITSKRIAFRSKHVPSLGINGFKGNDRCYVFLERYDLALPHNLEVNHTAAGNHTQFSNSDGTIPLGTNVDCYLVHSAPQGKRHFVGGQITFQGEILGVITSSDKLNATNDLFGSPWSLQCQHPERGLEGTPDWNSDRLQISRDRRTLQINMRTESIDQLRVLVSTAADRK